MIRFLLFTVVFAFSQLTFAQVRATTESGNKVLLFDNGTWKYEEKSVTAPITEMMTAVPGVGSSIEVDASKDIKTEFKELFVLPSPRLARYFGEQKGQIRCKLSCSNVLGAVKIHYLWEFPVGDGTRYFGYLKAGTKITFYMQDGQKIELKAGEDGTIKAREKYNFTAITGATLPLTNEQLSALTSQRFRKIEVDWKKKPEVYEVELSTYFMDILPTVF